LLLFAFLYLSVILHSGVNNTSVAGLRPLLTAICSVRYSCREYLSIPNKRKCYGYSAETYYSSIKQGN
jgi:hypothetical protein